MNEFIAWIAAFLESCLAFDFGVLDFIQQYTTGPIWDKVWPIVTLFGDAGIFWIIIAVILLFFPKTRKTGLAMGIAMVIGVLVCNVWLKNAVARCRPFLDMMPDKHDATHIVQGWFSQFHNGTPFTQWIAQFHDSAVLNASGLLVSAPNDFSFPSGHTIASFEACTVLLIRDKRMGIPATILAFLIAFSRMYLFVHYPTDVIVSFVLGILFAFVGCAIAAIIFKIFPPKKGKYEA